MSLIAECTAERNRNATTTIRTFFSFRPPGPKQYGPFFAASSRYQIEAEFGPWRRKTASIYIKVLHPFVQPVQTSPTSTYKFKENFMKRTLAIIALVLYSAVGLLAENGVVSSSNNPQQVALLHWYQANQAQTVFQAGGYPIAAAFDGQVSGLPMPAATATT
jgi:hypothetical protein